MKQYPKQACWYCDGTVHFDSDGIGDCDDCRETYSYEEFVERGLTKEQDEAVKIDLLIG